MRPRPPESTAQADAGAEEPANGERGDPGARVHPEPEPWPLRACSRRHASVPVGHRIRRTQTGHLISTGNRSRLSMACDRTTQQSRYLTPGKKFGEVPKKGDEWDPQRIPKK